MAEDTTFEPAPFQPVSEPHQLKAIADPLRSRMLHILGSREATNQQLSVVLDEPQAKVLHHVRVLLNAELIHLVREQVRGGNVEKYYRASARLYGFRPAPSDIEEFAGPVAVAGLESVSQELAASLTTWPDQPLYWEGRRSMLTPERAAEFNRRLQELIAEFWRDPDEVAEDRPDAALMAFASVMFRFPGEE